MVTKEDLESVEGRCPFCGGKLGEDWCANITCWHCKDKWNIKTEDSFYDTFGKYIETWYIDTRKIQSSKENTNE